MQKERLRVENRAYKFGMERDKEVRGSEWGERD